MATLADKQSQARKIQESTISIKTFMISISLTIVIIFSLWAWKTMERRSILRESQKESQRYKRLISAKSDATFKNNLLVFSKPLLWTISNDFLKGDGKAINTYLNQLTTLPNFQEASIIDNNGVIIFSSKRSEVGHLYSTFYNRTFLATDSVKLNMQRLNRIIITGPILGRTGRMASLSIDYLLPGKE
ncbi:hypothetical protein [Pedobacter agri]|uniref:hypothetical protein n=1 Tax=Pedobacter agri TaxID=454586 RepID=UPI002930AEDD|nr:hypothetical protein [Pedobacter agri]